LGLGEALLLRVAKRWIAGVDLDSVIEDAKRANRKGMKAIANFLGEEISDPAIADSHAAEYIALQEAINAGGIEGCASIKLTQFGLGSDDEGARRRLELIASKADKLNQPLWIDMEGSAVTSKTLEIYSEAKERHGRLGVALQAYMRRSEGDLEALLDRGGRVRLVKGAYGEPSEIVFPSRRKVTENFISLLRMLFERGDNFAVATHNSRLIAEARRLAESKGAKFEFEMLKGIRNELKEELVASGYRVSEYIPYGDRWLSYSRRRMEEHPSNFLLLLRSLV